MKTTIMLILFSLLFSIPAKAQVNPNAPFPFSHPPTSYSTEYSLLVTITSVAMADGGQGGMIFADVRGSAINYVFLFDRYGWRLNVGTYSGKWNKDGSLELQFPDAKGKLRHQRYTILEENAR